MSFHKPGWGTQPEHLFPPYASTLKRAPQQPPILLPVSASELTGPLNAAVLAGRAQSDLTHSGGGEALGERIHVCGRVLDENGRAVSNTLVEIWQCNAAGRYRHAGDQHDAPLDPYFVGTGHVLTDSEGRYRFKTIRPGAYPWRNHHNAWRPAHIHFSLLGPSFGTRLVTQMYFPGDPLLEYDPIYNSTPDEKARRRLVSSFDWEHTQPDHALGYRFDVCLRGRLETPLERESGRAR
jgi:protocatechuate 3,4-dioxygenase beta subunit